MSRERRNRRERPLRRRQLTNELKLRYSIFTALRLEAAMIRARAKLLPEHFPAYAQTYRILWAAGLDFYATYGRLPNEEQMRAEVQSKLMADSNPEAYDIEEIDQAIAELFEISIEELSVPVAMHWLKAFLEDCLSQEIGTIFAPASETPADVVRLLSDYQGRARDLSALASAELPLPFPADWSIQQDVIHTSSTGLPFLDSFLGGGHAPGEAHLVLGAYGSGKTLLAVQLSASVALLLYRQWLASGSQGPLPRVYLALYEDPASLARLRALSGLGLVPFETLAAGNPSLLSTAASLKDYERQLFAEQLARGEPVLGERERIADLAASLNHNWRIIDFCGQDDAQSTGRGAGLHDELVAVIEADLRATEDAQGQPQASLGCVVVDHVLAAVRKYVDYNGIEREHMRHYINEFPLNLKHRLLIPYHCPGWVFHQLDSEGQRLKPTQIATYAHAAEGKAIGEAVNFAFQLGKPQKGDGMLVFSCSKARRARLQEDKILQIDPMFTRLIEKEGWTVDYQSNRIVRRSELGMISPESFGDDDDFTGGGEGAEDPHPPDDDRPSPVDIVPRGPQP